MVNKTAGFWRRFGALLVDTALFVALVLASSLLIIRPQVLPIWPDQTIYQVNENWSYYLWLVLVLLLVVTEFLLLPLISGGQSLGQWLHGIRTTSVAPSELDIALFKRWQLGPFIWFLVIALFLVLIRPATVNKIALFNYIQSHIPAFQQLPAPAQQVLMDAYRLSAGETAALSIPATTASLNIMVQLLLLVSVGIKPSKCTLWDNLSATRVVCCHQLVALPPPLVGPAPEPEQKITISWKN